MTDTGEYFGRRFRQHGQGRYRSWTAADEIMVKNLLEDIEQISEAREAAEVTAKHADARSRVAERLMREERAAREAAERRSEALGSVVGNLERRVLGAEANAEMWRDDMEDLKAVYLTERAAREAAESERDMWKRHFDQYVEAYQNRWKGGSNRGRDQSESDRQGPESAGEDRAAAVPGHVEDELPDEGEGAHGAPGDDPTALRRRPGGA